MGRMLQCLSWAALAYIGLVALGLIIFLAFLIFRRDDNDEE